MADKQKHQSNKLNNQSNRPVEDSASSALNQSSGIRGNLLSGQIVSRPTASEGLFATSKDHQVEPTAVKPTRHIKKGRLVGIISVVALLLLSAIGLTFAYNGYRQSYLKTQKSKLANNIDTTSVDLASTGTSGIQGIGILQVNGDATISGSVTANTFNGSGADLTNLNANNITSGTLNDARLSANVALLDANQTFTGNNTFAGSNNFSGPSIFTGLVTLPGTLVINSQTYNLPTTQSAGALTNDGSGNLSWTASLACPSCIVNGGNAFGSTVIIGSTDAQDLNLITGGVTRVSFDTSGNASFTGTINGNGSGITSINGSNISSGTVADARLTSNVTLQGNVFNGALQLVQLDGAGALPALNGSALTNLNASNISSGTLNDARLSSNVPLLNAANVFSTTNTFSAGIVTNSIAPTGSLTIGSTTQAFVLQGTSASTISATSGPHITTLGFIAPTASNNIDIPNESGTICTTGSVCAGYAPASGASSYLNLQALTPGTAQTGNANITGTLIAGAFSGNGANLTGLDATHIANGTLSNSRLSTNVTLQGNTFNTASKLVQLDGTGALPALNGSALTSLNASNISSGTLADARLSANVALLNGNQTFSGNNTFTGGLVLPGSITINSNAYNFPASSGAGVLVNDGSGNLTWGAAGACPTCITTGGNSFGAAMSIGTNDNYDLTLRTNGVTRLTFDTAGDATFTGAIYGDGTQLTGVAKLALDNQTFTGTNQVFQNNTNTTTAFEVKNTGAVSLLTVDTTNSKVILSALETNTITPTSAMTIGDVTQSLSLQGSTNSTLVVSDGAFTTTLGYTGTATGNTTYNFDRAASPGTYNICTTAGNCTAGGNVTTAGGTAGKIAKFSSANGIADSLLSEAGSTVTADGTFKVVTVGSDYTSINSYGMSVYNNTAGTTTNYILPVAGNNTYDLCTSSGNCFGSGGSGANTALSNLNSSTIAINTSLLPGPIGPINLGSNTKPFGDLFIYGTSVTPASQNFKLTGTATAQRTITFPDENGTVCTTGSVCSGYGNNTLSNLGTVALNSVLQPASAGSLSLGVSTLPFSDLYLSGSSATPATNRFQITGTSTGGLRVLTMPDASGTICLENSTSCGFATSSGSGNYIQNQTASTQTAGFKINGTGTVGTINAISAIQLNGTSINTGGTLSNVAYKDQANTFTAAGTALTVNNNATISGTLTSGLINGQTISSAANFTGTATVAGSSLTLGTASTTNGSVVFKNGTNAFALTLSAPSTTQARAIYFPDEDGTVCTTGSVCSGYAPSGSYANTNLSNLGTTAINSDLNFVSASAKSITGPGAPGLTVTNTSGNLTLSTTTSGTLALNSDGAANISAHAASTWSIGAANDLSIISNNLNLNTGGALSVGSTGSSSGTLVLKNSAAGSGTITLAGNNTGASSYTITFPNESGTVCTTGSVCSGYAPSTGGSYANQALSNLSSVAINTSLLPGANNSIDAGSSGLAFRSVYGATSVLTPALDVISAGTLAIGNTTATGINIGNSTNAATITVGDGANTSTLKFGTGAGAKTVTIGSTNTTSITTINSGPSGRIDIAAGPNGGPYGVINIGNYNGALADAVTVFVGNTGTTSRTDIYGGSSGINLLTGTNGAINFATDSQNRFTISATASTLTGVGATTLTSSSSMTLSSAAASALTISSGTTGAVSIDSGSTGAINIGNGTCCAKTISIGSAASGTAVKTIKIGDGVAGTPNVITIGNVQNGGSISMGAGMTTGTITIGGTGAQTGTIGIGTGTGVQTINLATGGTGAKTVTLGSTASTGSTTVQSGTGGIAITSAGSLTLSRTDTFATSVGFSGTPTGIVTYNFDRSAAAGTYTVCTTSNNCLASGGGANQALSNLSSVAINTSLLPGADNSIDAGSSGLAFRSVYGATSILTPLVDTISAGSLSVGTGTATGLTLGKATYTVSIPGGLTTNGSGITTAGGSLSTSNGSLSLGSGNITTSGTYNGNTFTSSALTFSGAASVSSGGTNTAISLDGNGTGAVNIGATSTGDINFGGGSGSTGCTVTNSTGAFACTSTINGATISGGTLSGGNVSGGTLTATAVNSLLVSGTAITAGTGALAINADTTNTIDIGATSTGDINFGGGSGSTGCTVTNSNGNFACSGTGTFNGVSTGNMFVQGGNSFGTTASLGTNDVNNLVLRTGGAGRFTINSSSSNLQGTGATTYTSTGSTTLNAAVGSAITIGSTTTTGNISIGTALTTGQITIGTASSSGAISVTTGGALTLTGNSGATLANGSFESITANGGKITSVFNDLVSGNGISFQAYLGGEIAGINNFGFNSTYNVTAPGLDYSGALTIGGTSATSVSLGTAVTTGAITIGGTTQTGALTLGQSTLTNTISIGSSVGNGGTQTINLGTSSTGGSVTNVTIGSTISGSTTLQSITTNINSGTIATNQSSLNLFNTTASTINFGGAATAINIGAANSFLTLASNSTIQSANNTDLNVKAQGTGVLNLTGLNGIQLSTGTPTLTFNSSGNLSFNNAAHTIAIADSTGGTAGGALTIQGSAGSTPAAANTTGSAGGAIAITSGAGGTGSTTASGGAGGALTLSAGAGGASAGVANGGIGGAVTINAGTGGGTWNSGNGGAVSINAGGGCGGCIAGSTGTGGAVTITAGTGGNSNGFLGVSSTGGVGGALSLTAGTGGAGALTGNGATGGAVTITAGTGGTAGASGSYGAGGALTLSGGGGLGAGGNVVVKSADVAGNSGAITIQTGTSAFVSGDINIKTQAGSTAANTGRVIFTAPTDNASGALQLTAASTTTGTALRVDTTALTSGKGIYINGPTSGSTLTGNLLYVQTASTGNAGTTAGTSGLVAFDFSAAHTGYGFQVRSATTTGTVMRIVGNSVLSGRGLDIGVNNLTTGIGLALASTSNTQSYASTAFSGSLASIDYSKTYTSGAGSPVDSGNILSITRSETTNFAGSTATVSGSVLNVSDNSVQTLGVLNNSANVVSISQSYTSANVTGNALYVTSNNLTSTNGIVRFNFTGVRTASTAAGFVIDDASTTATAGSVTAASALQINSNSLTTGQAMQINVSAITSGYAFAIRKSGATSAAMSGNLFNVRAVDSPTNVTGNLASIIFEGSSATNTGKMLYIDGSAGGTTGGLNQMQSLVIVNPQTVSPTGGLVQFNFTGARTAANNGFQIDDVSTTLATTMAINSNALTTGVGLSISTTSISTPSSLTDNTAGAAIRINVGTGTGKRYAEFRNGTSVIGSITQSAATTTAYNTTSDVRLKENISDTDYNLDTVLALQVHDYNFKNDPDKQKLTGFIAQELYNLFPEAVTVGNNAVDENGVLQNPWQVDYGKLTPLLTKGIQDLNTKVDTMQNGLSTSVLQAIADANAITINGTLTINGITIFNGDTKFNGDITVNQDGAGEATILSGTNSVDVTFSKTLASIPMVTASPQDFIDGQYKITNVTKNGFTIRTSANQSSDAKFNWTAVQK